MSAIIRYPNVRLKWYHKLIYKIFGNPYKDALDQYCEEVKDLGKNFDAVSKELDMIHIRKKLNRLLDPPCRVGENFYLVIDAEYNKEKGNNFANHIIATRISDTKSLNMICVECEAQCFVMMQDKILVCTHLGDANYAFDLNTPNIFFKSTEALEFMHKKKDDASEVFIADDSINIYKIKSK